MDLWNYEVPFPSIQQHQSGVVLQGLQASCVSKSFNVLECRHLEVVILLNLSPIFL